MMKKWLSLLLALILLLPLAACSSADFMYEDEDEEDEESEEQVKRVKVNGKYVKVGDVITFGKLAGNNVQWVITDLKVVNDQIVGFLITKDIVFNPNGWGEDLTWKNSQLKIAAEKNFWGILDADKSRVLKTKFAVPEGEATGFVWVPSVAEIEAMQKNEALKDYVAAGPAKSATGVKVAIGKKTANYYLRDIGENGLVSGVNTEGEIKLGFSPAASTQNAIGVRFCICLDLGEA